MDTKAKFQKAAQLLSLADAIVITAGAGMSVDSGLPDFRGDEGFWNAYPAYRHLGLAFSDLANPRWFEQNPALAWGFYGHRLNLYRATPPHTGYDVLKRFSDNARYGSFVFTSNVDGAFEKAGFDPERIVEHHGSIHHAQCSESCTGSIILADDIRIDVDLNTFEAKGPLPKCWKCGSVLRPNILMFGDPLWNYSRSHAQSDRMQTWVNQLVVKDVPTVIVEVGAGTAIPSVRAKSESLARILGAPLIRINPRDSEGPAGTFSIPMSAKTALVELEILAKE